jgi:thioesterase domain-containing protein
MTTAELLDYANTLHAPAFLGAELVSAAADKVVLRSPANVNRNDKGGAFAGSMYSLCELGGWLMCVQQAGSPNFDIDMLQGDIHYLSPILDDIILETTLRDSVDMSRVNAGETTHCEVIGSFIENGKIAANFTGIYSIRLPATP